ncbi:BppU family phage baseplate upper protein [Enterococcus raffinosus]|uniref:BppU family phage baseplate upper protein n=1 Tax=Enterococcus raffinosus TaxID=71452 RepID=UPI001DF41CBF|nr:BppU family phage baseplate upper protein [Enterococcus raffinosus]MBS6429326.1 BppU family phage baseplate upper protein [Enterococcus raffinosus]
MSNIKLILTENKATPYRKQRVVGRLGDGGLTTIDVELLQSDGKTPYAVFSNHELIFVGTNAKGEYTDGVPEILDGQKGIIRYTFTKENFSVLKEFKRAYFQLTDAEGSRVTFQDFTVDVLNNSDIDQGQVTLYVRLLDQLLADFEKRFGNQSVDFEERFKVFLQAKDLQYQNIYQMYNDLVIKLDKLSKDTKSIQEMQAEILKSIEEHDVFTKQESSANVIDQIIGKEKGQISIITDFKNKVTNSNVENPHWAGAAFVGDKLEKPSYFVTEVAQTRYNSLSEKDGNTAFVTATGADLRPSLCLKYDLLEIVKRRLGEDFFIDREATTTEQQLSLLDAIVTNFEVGTYAKGTGVEAGKATNWCASKLWFDNSRWTTGTPQNTTGEIKRLAFALDPVNKLSRYLDEKGILQVIVYGGLSDGVTNTNVYVDYSDLLIDIEVSSNKHIKSIVAANHVENLATEEEAKTGEDNTKTMTPLRVFQSIAQWTKNKFISLTENETVLGIKNFANGLQVGGNNVLTQNGEIRFVTNSTNNSSLESGAIVFKRYGDDVDIYANFQVRASGDLTRDMNIVAESIVDDIFEPGENFSFFVGNETAQAVVKFVGKGIKAHSTLTKGIWYVGTASYKAKNKL